MDIMPAALFGTRLWHGYPIQTVLVCQSCMRWHVLFPQVLLFYLLTQATPGHLALNATTNLYCDSAADFVRLLADPTASAAYIRKNFTLNNDDWLDFGIIILNRSFTFEGTAPSYIKLDFNFVHDKVTNAGCACMVYGRQYSTGLSGQITVRRAHYVQLD